MDFIDAHTHVQFAAFDADRREVMERASRSGVSMVNVGTQRDTSRKAVGLAREWGTGVYAAVGLHPIHTEKSFHDTKELGGSGDAKGFTSRGEKFDYAYYKKLAENPQVVAIGECGLDYYRLSRETKLKQAEAFVAQIELARELRKPLMIHCRAAFEDLIKILDSQSRILNSPPGIIHFFSGTVHDAQKLLALGFYFTFGGVITFPPKAGRRTGDYDEIIKILPLDRILSETDAPYVAPVPYRGKRNEPSYVVEVVKKLAEVKAKSFEVVSGQILNNAKRIFLI